MEFSAFPVTYFSLEASLSHYFSYSSLNVLSHFTLPYFLP